MVQIENIMTSSGDEYTIEHYDAVHITSDIPHNLASRAAEQALERFIADGWIMQSS